MKNSILFDLDGTLWDTTLEVELVWNEVALEYGLHITKQQIKKIMGLTKEDIIEYLFSENKNKGNEFITKCQQKENEYLRKNGGHIYKNTIKTIKNLVNKYDLYIISNCQAGYIEAFLNHYKLEKYFKDYESSGNTGKQKEDNIKIVMERNNIQNGIYVGDTMKDYLASLKNNIKFVWAKYGFGICDSYNAYINDILDLDNTINSL